MAGPDESNFLPGPHESWLANAVPVHCFKVQVQNEYGNSLELYKLYNINTRLSAGVDDVVVGPRMPQKLPPSPTRRPIDLPSDAAEDHCRCSPSSRYFQKMVRGPYDAVAAVGNDAGRTAAAEVAAAAAVVAARLAEAAGAYIAGAHLRMDAAWNDTCVLTAAVAAASCGT